MSVGQEFTLESIVTDMMNRKVPVRRPTMRQPDQRVAMILKEYANNGILERTEVKSGTTISFRLLKLVE